MYVGDLCISIIDFGGYRGTLVCAYINPNTSFDRIKCFLEEYCNFLKAGEVLGSAPLFLCEDFNFDVSREAKRRQVEVFMEQTFSSKLVNEPNMCTTRQNSCIDLVFVRNVELSDCVAHVSYFSYHQPVFVTLKNMLTPSNML